MDIDQLIDLSPPVALAGVLALVGFYLKKSPVQDWLIPLILISLGALIYPLVAEIVTKPEAGKQLYNVKNPYVFKTLIGALIGGFAVGGHQVIRQLGYFLESRKAGGLKEGETAIIKKPEEPTEETKP